MYTLKLIKNMTKKEQVKLSKAISSWKTKDGKGESVKGYNDILFLSEEHQGFLGFRQDPGWSSSDNNEGDNKIIWGNENFDIDNFEEFGAIYKYFEDNIYEYED